MTMGATTFRLSERIVDTSDVLFNLTRMGLGRLDCFLYFSSLK